ncbi:protein of unknown function [Burkholderia multivorans]
MCFSVAQARPPASEAHIVVVSKWSLDNVDDCS